MLRAAESLRVLLLLFTVPATVLWARGLDPLGVVAGPLLVVTHACVTLLWLSSLLQADLDEGIAPRLGMRRTILSVDLLALDMARPILLALSLALGIALLVAQFWIGLGALLAIGLALRQAGLPRGERHARVELILPVVLLAGPALLFRAHSWPTPRMLRIFSSSPDAPAELRDLLRAEPVTPDLVTSAGLAASCLIAATLALTLLLLQLRDREADRLDRVHTTASQLSAPGAAALAWAWSLGVMLLAAMGAGAGWWHWGAALLAAWTGAASMALVTAGVRGYAAGVGFAGYAAMSLLIAISTV